MAEYNAFYRRATYYDVVFRRDVRPEIEFIHHVYAAHNGTPPKSLLDLACGPGYHARTFAAMGGRAIGLDLRPEMIEFATQAAHAEGVNVEFIAQDMRDMHLSAPVDVVLNVFDGIDCLTSNEDLLANFKSTGANLTPGGLYFVDVTNPTLTSYNHYDNFHYSGQRDGISVNIVWATNQPKIDVLTHISHTAIQMHINDNGESFVIEDFAEERLLTAQEIVLLAQLSGVLRPVAWYGAYDLNTPLSNHSPRMIAVLQKFG